MGNLVAIVGRPNVGKSTLFNRFTQTRHAIVADEAGTTRDRQYGKCEWTGREFSIVDTGGWVVNSDDIFEEEIRKQVLIAVEEADVVLFLVDVQNGVTDLDDHVAEILRKSKKPVMLVANKVDSNDWLYNVPEFYSLGLGDPYPVSAVSGYGTGDFLDDVELTREVVKLSLNISKAVDTRDNLRSVLTQTVQDNAQWVLTNLVCHLCDLDSALSSSE